MGAGRWNTTVNAMGIQYHESMKILGIHFTTTVRQSALRSSSVVRDGIRAQARETQSRELNLNKRILYVQYYMLAGAWFTAQVFPFAAGLQTTNQHGSSMVYMETRHFSASIINPPTAERTGRMRIDPCRCEMPRPVAFPLITTKA